MAWLKLTHRYLNTDHISEVRLHESELTVVFDRPSPRGRAGAETENLEGSDAQVLRDWLESQDEST